MVIVDVLFFFLFYFFLSFFSFFVSVMLRCLHAQGFGGSDAENAAGQARDGCQRCRRAAAASPHLLASVSVVKERLARLGLTPCVCLFFFLPPFPFLFCSFFLFVAVLIGTIARTGTTR